MPEGREVARLSNNAISDRLTAARELLGEEPGATIEGNTALETARRALALLNMGLVAADEARVDREEIAKHGGTGRSRNRKRPA